MAEGPDVQPSTQVDDLGATLLRYLRRILDTPDLEYEAAPAQIAPGTEATVIGFSLRSAPARFDGPLVLRVMHSSDDQREIAVEHAIQNAVADMGFPAPYVLGSSSTGEGLGAPFLVMQRMPGVPCAHPHNAVELQMETLAQLHGLATQPIERSLEDHGVPAAERYGSYLAEIAAEIEAWDLGRMRPLVQWLEDHAPPTAPVAICHGDAHLCNMLLADGRITAVIDWGTARFNDAELDIGVLCAYARCGTHPSSADANPQQAAVDRLIAAYSRHRMLDPQKLLYYEAECLASILVNITVKAIRRAAGESVAANPIHDHPRTVDLIKARLEPVMEVPIPVPHELVADLSGTRARSRLDRSVRP